MKYAILLVILFSCTLTSHSQRSISGRVISAYDGSPISMPTIRIQGRLIGVVGDSLGYFILPDLEPKKYKITISSFTSDDLDTLIDLTENSVVNQEIIINTACTDFNVATAKNDIARGELRLLLFGSIAPAANTKADNRFERKYNLRYQDFGCMPPTAECIKRYNYTIFRYLDATYGTVWREKVRQDTQFLNSYTASH